jgi:hypothetical protein
MDFITWMQILFKMRIQKYDQTTQCNVECVNVYLWYVEMMYLIINLMFEKHYTKFKLFVYNCNLKSREMS